MNEQQLRQHWQEMQRGATPFQANNIRSPVLALIPHADDETLGCGALLAALENTDIVLVTDGTQSHPNSASHSIEQRRNVREREFLNALRELGAAQSTVKFWRLPDSRMPKFDDKKKTQCRSELSDLLAQKPYGTILTPWRRDPHGDHRATTSLLLEVLKGHDEAPRVLEYFVWMGQQGNSDSYPLPSESISVLSFDARPYIKLKKKALACHVSQLSELFEDPSGFTIPAALADTVNTTHEYYLEL